MTDDINEVEHIRARVALSVALLALDLIASGSGLDPQHVAAVTLRRIKEQYGFSPENT
jgi:hypothetical protein